MPANLTPQYKEAEERFKAAEAVSDKIEALREMMAVIPKHKGTEKLQADLKRRMAKLLDQSEHGHAAGARRHDPGHVEREGAGQVVLVGTANVGKSSLLAALTHAHPAIGPYPFTTRAPQPGMMPFEDVQVQLVDTPPVTPQGWEGYMVNLVQGADVVALVFDLGADDVLDQPGVVEPLLARAHVVPKAAEAERDAAPAPLLAHAHVIPRAAAGGVPGVFFNCGAFIRRDAFLNAGGFPIDFDYYVEEYDLCCRLWRDGWRVRFHRLWKSFHAI